MPSLRPLKERMIILRAEKKRRSFHELQGLKEKEIKKEYTIIKKDMQKKKEKIMYYISYLTNKEVPF